MFGFVVVVVVFIFQSLGKILRTGVKLTMTKLVLCEIGIFVKSTIHDTNRWVYHIVAYLQVGVYHIVAYHDHNFIRKWTSGICRVRKLYRI